MSLKYNKLDPAHYTSASGLSWDAMLKYTGVELELLTDLDIYIIISLFCVCVCVFVCLTGYRLGPWRS